MNGQAFERADEGASQSVSQSERSYSFRYKWTMAQASADKIWPIKWCLHNGHTSTHTHAHTHSESERGATLSMAANCLAEECPAFSAGGTPYLHDLTRPSAAI